MPAAPPLNLPQFPIVPRTPGPLHVGEPVAVLPIGTPIGNTGTFRQRGMRGDRAKWLQIYVINEVLYMLHALYWASDTPDIGLVLDAIIPGYSRDGLNLQLIGERRGLALATELIVALFPEAKLDFYCRSNLWGQEKLQARGVWRSHTGVQNKMRIRIPHA